MEHTFTHWLTSTFGISEGALIQAQLKSSGATCKESHDHCKELLLLVLDGQATEAQEQEFKNKILTCFDCFKKFFQDYTVKKAIQEKVMFKVPATELEGHIRQSIAELN